MQLVARDSVAGSVPRIPFGMYMRALSFSSRNAHSSGCNPGSVIGMYALIFSHGLLFRKPLCCPRLTDLLTAQQDTSYRQDRLHSLEEVRAVWNQVKGTVNNKSCNRALVGTYAFSRLVAFKTMRHRVWGTRIVE